MPRLSFTSRPRLAKTAERGRSDSSSKFVSSPELSPSAPSVRFLLFSNIPNERIPNERRAARSPDKQQVRKKGEDAPSLDLQRWSILDLVHVMEPIRSYNKNAAAPLRKRRGPKWRWAEKRGRKRLPSRVLSLSSFEKTALASARQQGRQKPVCNK
eukprot:681058-Prorocentrum_minimum.AAC.2